jgi:ATP-dependent DNA helicase RecQ
VVREALEERDRRREFDRSRLDMIRAYAETTDCRRRVVLELLGEDYPERCLNCDNCDAGSSEEASERPYPIGSQVAHTEWGKGTVSHYEADRVVVLFADAGYRTLALGLVREKGLLTAA